MEIDIHFIREKIDTKELVLPYIKTENQVIDVFTKGLFYCDFERNVCLNIFDMYT